MKVHHVCRTTADHNQRLRELPDHQRIQGCQSWPSVARLMSGTRRYGLIERGRWQDDRGSIDAG